MTMTPPRSKDDPRLDVARENLRIACAIRDVNPTEISRRAGLSINGLGNFLRGANSIKYDSLLRVCDALDVPIGILHVPNSISPARLELHSALKNVSPEQLTRALSILEDLRK